MSKQLRNGKIKLKKDNVPEAKRILGYVGIANLPNQVHMKAVKRGFDFTVMVVGESGLGKSTLVNSMFLTDIYSADHPGPTLRIKKTVSVESTTVELNENGVQLRLTVVDSPGYGDAVDNSNCWTPIIEFIESRHEDYLAEESKVSRRVGLDRRVHCCLYFIQPSGHGLKPLDIEFMRRICTKVNLIPIVAKADTLMPQECAAFKKQILREIALNNIKIYRFPDDDDFSSKYQELVPFAVIGSNAMCEVEGRMVKGRKYPWGTVDVARPDHSDFTALRDTLISTHMQDLIDVTNDVHYENYRSKRLAALGLVGECAQINNGNPLSRILDEQRLHDLKLKKTKMVLEDAFAKSVEQKLAKLKETEAQFQKKYEAAMEALEEQRKELAEKRKQFELEVLEWESNNQAEDNNRSNDDSKRVKNINLFQKINYL